jgi:hypothetical protein
VPRQRLTPAAAAALRAATAPARRPLALVVRTFLCEPCLVTWTGDEADCWSCGKPATAAFARRRRASRALLAPAGRPARHFRRRKGALR